MGMIVGMAWCAAVGQQEVGRHGVHVPGPTSMCSRVQCTLRMCVCPCADSTETRVRVVAALSLLAVSKALNINVPIILKLAVDCLAGGAASQQASQPLVHAAQQLRACIHVYICACAAERLQCRGVPASAPNQRVW